jgi:cytosine deaminase
VIPNTDHYWLKNAHVPVALLSHPGDLTPQTREGLVQVDLEIQAGRIAQILPAATVEPIALPFLDLRRGIIFPCFVDLHTHLDKGHIWERSPNLTGTFDDALATVYEDSTQSWRAKDVYRRMEFGLKCSYAHGTQAIRTHIDSVDQQAEISFEVFKALQTAWCDRLTLQAVCLVSLDYFLTPAGEHLADLVAEVGGILGGVPWMSDQIEQEIDRTFELAKARNLDLDFHTDESGNPDDITLQLVAEAALRHEFSGQIVCGHCCSLAVQPPDQMLKTLHLVKQAGIGIVSLPMCNLFLQDRNQASALNSQHSTTLFPSLTPRWRGVTLLHELHHSGIPVAVASDNCRDPFYGFGDHDVLEVLTQATRIVQLDAPYGNWCRTVTTTPADLMGLSNIGRIQVGGAADLILFKARYFSELLSRPQLDRIVLRQGRAIDTTLPAYEELDDLLGLSNC